MATTFDATQVIPESEVSIERIRDAFRSAFLDANIDRNGDIAVDPDVPPFTIVVSRPQQPDLLRLSTTRLGIVALQGNEEPQLIAAADMNRRLGLGRVIYIRHIGFKFVHDLLLEPGITAPNLVATLRQFALEARQAVEAKTGEVDGG